MALPRGTSETLGLRTTNPAEKRIRVLVVDDDAMLLETTQALLESEFEVRSASSGQQALEALHEESADVVCTDFNMPEMTGFELLEKVSKRWSATMGVLLTGFREQMPSGARRAEFVFGIMYKPYEEQALVNLIRDASRTAAMSRAASSFARGTDRLKGKNAV